MSDDLMHGVSNACAKEISILDDETNPALKTESPRSVYLPPVVSVEMTDMRMCVGCQKTLAVGS